ncbi:MAG TPA: hypothetical protein PLR99_30740 [Polyangiaceae bacterium]|nr:hypothetical protein [Polyangiaceae bacterium]
MSARYTPFALLSVAFLGLAGASLAACAGSEDPTVDDPAATTDAGPAKDAATAPVDAAKPPPTDAAPKDTCAPACATDEQCKTSCTAPSTGTFCCDVAIGKCYKYTASVCPAPVDPPDSSTPPTTSP